MAGAAPLVAMACRQKGAFQRSGLAGVSGVPLVGGSEPGPAVKMAVVAAGGRPRVGVVDEPLAYQEPDTVGVDPLPQPWPGAQERLVADLDVLPVGGQQPGAGELLHHRGAASVSGQFVAVRAPAGVVGALTDADQAQQHPTGGLAFPRAEPGICTLGRRCDGTVYPTGAFVSGDGEHPVGAVLPGGAQGVGEQRQCSGLAVARAQIPHEDLDQTGFQRQAGSRGGFADRLAQFLGRHRSQGHGPHAQCLAQSGVGQAMTVEIGTHSDDHGEPTSSEAAELVGEGLTFVLGGEGEQLLELVHDQQSVAVERSLLGAGTQLSHRMGGRGEAEDRWFAWHPPRQSAPCHGCRQTGAEQGRLADPGGPEHHHGVFVDTGVSQQAHQVRHGAFASEEPACVVRTERCQAAVGARLGHTCDECEQCAAGLESLVAAAGEFLVRTPEPVLQTADVALVRVQLLRQGRL